MLNDRPIDDPNIQEALDIVKGVFAHYGLAGACMLVGPKESAFTYKMDAPWSACQPDPTTPLGFRIKTSLAEHGQKGRHARLEGAAHTFCTLSDFGAQTMDWMEQLKMILRKSGLEIEHIPFGGKPLPSIGTGS